MICKSCSVAGELVAVARREHLADPEAPGLILIKVDQYVETAIDSATINVPTKEAVRSVAHLYHGICKGKSHCDCQHKIDFEGRLTVNGQG